MVYSCPGDFLILLNKLKGLDLKKKACVQLLYFSHFCTDIILICPGCTSEMKEIPNDKLKMCCDCDDRKMSKKDLKELGCYSLHVPIEEQLRRLLQDHNLEQHADYCFKRKAYDGNNISDVYDGRLYREFDGGRLLEDPNALSLLMNTYGAPVFNSSKTSIWPVYYDINELPPNLRKKYPVLGGLQYGPTKPNINSLKKNNYGTKKP